MTKEMQDALERELNDAKAIEELARRHDAIEMVQSHMLAALLDCQRKTADRVKDLVSRADNAKAKVEGAKWDLYKASSWWCISEELAKHVLDTYLQHPEIRQYFRDSFGQDETLIQTIAFNSPEWASRCILTEGAYPGLDALTPLHYIVYEPVIQVMKADDLPALMASGKMFARKFQSGKSEEVIEKINALRTS